jgi:hypothetical protein
LKKKHLIIYSACIACPGGYVFGAKPNLITSVAEFFLSVDYAANQNDFLAKIYVGSSHRGTRRPMQKSSFLDNFWNQLGNCVGRGRGEGTQTPSLLSPPGPGSVRLCNAMETELPHSPSLPPASYSCEIADSHPYQTICPTLNCCHVLTEIAGQPGSDFSHREKEYTIHSCTNI